MIRPSMRLLALVFILGFSIPGYSKCACLIMTIEVEVRGQVKPEQSVMADVAPESFWSFQLAGSSANHFVIQIPFDTFSGQSPFGGDRCSRAPRTIAVMLQDWLQTVDAFELKFPQDFVSDRVGYYHAREKVVLDVDHVGPPWIRSTGKPAMKSSPKK
jgi:hypothetical protein